MANNIRIKRLNHAFMEEISMILLEEIKDDEFKFVTITDCDITNDLSFAKVYFTCFNEDRELVLKELKTSAGFLRHELSERIDIRHTPELTFLYDESLEYAKKIEDKIKEIHEK